MRFGFYRVLTCVLLAGCVPPESAPPEHPVSLDLSGGEEEILPLGRELRLAADAIFADGTRQRLTANAQWTSSDEKVIRVEPPPALPGTIRAVGQGLAELSVQFEELRSTVRVNVGPRALDELELRVLPAEATAAKGERLRASALGRWSDGEAEDLTALARWNSSDALVLTAAPGEGPGVFFASGEGTARILAEVEGVPGAVELTVGPAQIDRLELDPPALTLAQGTRAPLAVTAIYTDATVKDVTAEVSWESSDSGVADLVEGEQVVEAKELGGTVITATLGELSVPVEVEVTAAVLTRLDLAPSVMTLPSGISTQVSAVGTFSDGSTQDLTAQVAWSTSDAAVLSLLDHASPGAVLAGQPGVALLRAGLGAIEALAQVTVSAAQLSTLEILPGAPVVQKTTTIPLQAAAYLTDGSVVDVATQAQWASSNPSVAAVDAQGRVTGLNEGTTIITALYQGKHPSVTLTVSAAPLTSLQISAASASLARGYTQPLTATGLFADGHSEELSASVLWTSSDPTVAAVSNAPGTRGTCTAMAVGTAIITATYGGESATFLLSVSPAVLDSVDLQPSSPAIPLGLSAQLHATGVFSDGTRVDLTRASSWSSSSPSVAPVDPGGEAHALQQGTAVITATYGSHSAQVSLSVTPAVILRVVSAGSLISLPVGSSTQLDATALWSDGAQDDVTATAAWTSDDAAIASVSTQAGSEGVVQAQSVGATTIRASYAGFVAPIRVEVTAQVGLVSSGAATFTMQ